MRRESIIMIWVGGLVLAALIYAVGPDRFIDACINLFDTIDMMFRNLAFTLGAQAYGVIRALAIALYVVFAILAVLAGQRGHRSFWTFIVVTVVILTLVWRPYAGFAPISHWFASLVVVLVGAVMMSQRLTRDPSRSRMPPPYPPSGRMP